MTRKFLNTGRAKARRLQLAVSVVVGALTAASVAHAVPVAAVAAILPATFAAAATAITFVVNTAITMTVACVGERAFRPKDGGSER